MKPFTDSSDIVMDGNALAARVERDGCVFFKGLLPRETVTNLRRQFLDIAAEVGWLKPGRRLGLRTRRHDDHRFQPANHHRHRG